MSAIERLAPFAVACASGMVATVCIQPIDTVKVRMQLMDRATVRTSPWGVAKGMVSEGGFVNLYQGLSAGLSRQLVYGTLRLGLFTTFERKLEEELSKIGRRSVFGNGPGQVLPREQPQHSAAIPRKWHWYACKPMG